MDDILLTLQQKNGMYKVIKRLEQHERISTIAGYAGTGKTTLIRYIIEEMNLMKNTVFVSYTGRASLVLRSKGLPATTIHRLIYEVKKSKNKKRNRNRRLDQIEFVKKIRLSEHIKLIIVDEISMVPLHLLADLASYKIPVVALGDPFQLPPVDGSDNGILDNPHVFLDEIHRQAKDNEIIDLSMRVRNGERLTLHKGSNVAIIKKSILRVESMQAADQIICGRNNTRQRINKYFREEILGRESLLPIKGDKMVCLKNDWQIGSRLEDIPLINGMIGYANNSAMVGFDNLFDLYFAPTHNLSDTYSELRVSANPFNDKGFKHDRQGINHFDYGYAITVHKAQGSEFPNIIIMDEKIDRKTYLRQLYTAITRATQNVIIVMED